MRSAANVVFNIAELRSFILRKRGNAMRREWFELRQEEFGPLFEGDA